MLNGKVMIICFIAGQIKKISLYKMSYFPERYSHSKNKIKLKIDLSNYATKSGLKSATGFDTSKLAKKADSDKSDSDKSETTPVNLSRLSNVVKNDLVTKDCI